MWVNTNSLAPSRTFLRFRFIRASANLRHRRRLDRRRIGQSGGIFNPRGYRFHLRFDLLAALGTPFAVEHLSSPR